MTIRQESLKNRRTAGVAPLRLSHTAAPNTTIDSPSSARRAPSVWRALPYLVGGPPPTVSATMPPSVLVPRTTTASPGRKPLDGTRSAALVPRQPDNPGDSLD